MEQALDEAGKGKDLFELKSRIENGGGSLKEEEGSFGTGTLKMEYLEFAKGITTLCRDSFTGMSIRRFFGL